MTMYQVSFVRRNVVTNNVIVSIGITETLKVTVTGSLPSVTGDIDISSLIQPTQVDTSSRRTRRPSVSVLTMGDVSFQVWSPRTPKRCLWEFPRASTS